MVCATENRRPRGENGKSSKSSGDFRKRCRTENRGKHRREPDSKGFVTRTPRGGERSGGSVGGAKRDRVRKSALSAKDPGEGVEKAKKSRT